MQISIITELTVFFSAVTCGAVCGMLFDVFRALRRAVRMNSAFVGASDMLFWVIVMALSGYCSFAINGGLLRAFVICGYFLGGILYFLSISRLMFLAFVKIIEIICKIIKLFFKILLTPLHFSYKIILIPIFGFKKILNWSKSHEFNQDVAQNEKK